MKRTHLMRWFCALAAATTLTTAAMAQTGGALHASTDDFRAPLLNPAALAVGNARGFAFDIGYENRSAAGFSAEVDDLSLFLAGDSLGYVYQRIDDENLHTFSFAFAPGDNVYLGTGSTLPSFNFDQAIYRIGVLARPLNLLSLSGTARYLAAPEDWEFTLGGALRPPGAVAPALQNRLTVAAETDLVDGSFSAPRIGVETELVDGLRADLRWDFSDESLVLGVSFALPHVRVGNQNRFDDGRVANGSVFLHAGPKRFRSVARRVESTYVEYAPGPSIIEQRSWPAFFPFSLWDSTITLPEVLDQIAVLRDDPGVAGIVFIDHNLRASHAGFLDIAAALQDFRAAGKEVIFYFEQTNTLNYALAASVADEIYLHPHGYLNLVGLTSIRIYLGELFERLGIEFVAFRSDDYKTGADTLTLDRMSDAEREALDSLLDSLYETVLAGIEQGRGTQLTAPAAELIDRGPYLIARNALEAGLVDGLLYRDELEDSIESRHRNARIAEATFPDTIRYDWSLPRRSPVALIYAVGDILGGESDLDVAIGSTTLARALRRAREDDAIEGVLLRIASGGGSSLGSDVIAREVALTAREKPVVVSMGGVAASGGYYIAAPADRIVAQPTTVTGSIGVFAVLPNIEDLSRNIGVNWDAIRRGERADFGIPFRRLTVGEADLIQESIDASYQRFIEVVAEGRGMEEDAVHAAGQGRVWTGAQAHDLGLVDQLGGWHTAMETVRQLTAPDWDPDRAIKLVPIHGRRGPLPTQLPRRIIHARARSGLPYEVQLLADAIEALGRYGDEIILMRLPYEYSGLLQQR